MKKYAGLGSTLLSMGSKIMSNNTVRSMGSMALNAGRTAMKNPVTRNMVKGSVTGMAIGALNSQPDSNGNRHVVQNALRGGAMGAGIGAGIGTSQQFAPQIKNYGSEILNGVRQSIPRQMNETR